MKEFHDVHSLLPVLRNLAEHHATVLIGVEGHSTSGKSTLGSALARVPHWTAVATDSYVTPTAKAPTYTERLDLERLRADLADILSGQHSIVFIEGICLRDTVARIDTAPKAYVYCKRVTQAGLWADDPEDLEGDSWVDQQSIEYHGRVDPEHGHLGGDLRAGASWRRSKRRSAVNWRGLREGYGRVTRDSAG